MAQLREVVPTIYIIEAILANKETYYKVGFTDVTDNSRPLGLVKKYREQNPNNQITLLKTIKLPLYHKKYFDDDMVREELYILNFLNIKSVDSAYIARNIGVDGKNEFVEVLDNSLNIITEVERAINSLAQNKNNFKYNVRNILHYDSPLSHLVSVKLIDNIEKKLQYNISSLLNKNILLIGQFEPEWLSTFILQNNVYCICDDADQRPTFKYQPLNDKIIYKNNIEEIINMHIDFDLILSNPPYSSIGANITATIKDNLNYKEFINLLPSNDYKRNEDKDLFQYARDMEPVNDGFADAAVTTHLARIVKQSNGMSLDEFEISNYIDRDLDLYFTEQRKRTHYAIDNAVYKPKLAGFAQKFDLRKCIFIGKRYISDEHLPYTRDCAGYKVNVEHSLDHQGLINISAKSEQANGNVGDFSLIYFNTDEEQDNISEWMYSPEGFRMFSKIVVAMNADSYCPASYFLPKVDWKHKWTTKEILIDYGYTPEKADTVIADLGRFKYMKD